MVGAKVAVYFYTKLFGLLISLLPLLLLRGCA
jgi:hypothetical protein